MTFVSFGISFFFLNFFFNVYIEWIFIIFGNSYLDIIFLVYILLSSIIFNFFSTFNVIFCSTMGFCPFFVCFVVLQFFFYFSDSLPLSQRLSYQLTPDPLALDGESDKELPQMGSNSQPPNLNVSGSGNGVASSIGSMSGSEAAPASKQENSEEPQVDEVCLRWNSHHSNMKTSLPTLLGREQYVDCTLVAEGKSLKCHRVSIFISLLSNF